MGFIKVVLCVRWTDWTNIFKYFMCDILIFNDALHYLGKVIKSEFKDGRLEGKVW